MFSQNLPGGDICIELSLVVGGGGWWLQYVNTTVSFTLSNAIRLCCDTTGLSWTSLFPHTDTSASHRNISIMPRVPLSLPRDPNIITGIMGRQ